MSNEMHAPDVFDSQEFYELCQAYRHAGDPMPKAAGLPSASEAFGDIKAFARSERDRLAAQNAKLRRQRDELAAAVKAVSWFDWSDNDRDAVDAIEALRAALAKFLA